jgi:hypothetical protein
VLLRFLDPMLRGAAGVGSWQVVSQGRAEARGSLALMPDLAGIQGRRFAEPQVILADRLTGNEDIPVGLGRGRGRGRVMVRGGRGLQRTVWGAVTFARRATAQGSPLVAAGWGRGRN